MKSAVREGGCGCGAVRFRVTGLPIMVHNCHCRQCQQQTGGTSVVNGFWEGDAITWLSGELADAELSGGSGASHIIRRCSACGTAIVSHYGRLGRLLAAIRAGVLDEPASITPDVVIFTDEKMPWVTLPEGIPAFPQYYDPREQLSAASLDRLRVLGDRRKAGEG